MSFAKIAVAGGAMLVASAGAFACSSSDASSPTPSGGTSDGGTTTSEAGTTTNPDGTTCTGPTATQIALVSPQASHLAQNDTSLFLWENDGGDAASVGSGKTGSIVKVSKSTGEVAVIYKPSVLSHKVLGVAASGDDVFTTEEDYTLDNTTPSVLVHIAASTGTVTAIASLPHSGDGFGDIVAIDDATVFFFHGDFLYRVPRAGGTPAKIGDFSDGLFDAQVVGPDLILSKRLSSESPVWRVPRTATTMAQAVKLGDSSNCFGQLVAVTGGYYCASSIALLKEDATFKTGEKVYDLLDTDPDGSLPRIVGIDGTHVLFGAKGSAAKPTTFRSLEVGATTTSTIGCGVGSWLEGVYDASAIYLLQLQVGDGANQQIVKIAR